MSICIIYISLLRFIILCHNIIQLTATKSTCCNSSQEKAALLRSLEGQKNHIEAERLRQLELAKLKRDKRRTKEEDKFESAARLLNLSKEQGEA